MKFLRLQLITILAILVSGLANAQTPVELHITHKLGGIAPFNYNQQSYNDLGNEFSLSRVEYFISRVTIIHDGGMSTSVPDHYILVDGNQDVVDQLGSFNITNVEAIRFSVGVDTPVNHEDPSLQPSGHPLAPKSPSMHWGWAAGYRFAALEGKSGSGLAQTFEIHALGDVNYFEQTVTVSGISRSGKIIIGLNADYAAALKGLDLSSGLLRHGETDEAVTLLQNFRDHVFKAGNPVSVDNITSNSLDFGAYPNPSNGDITVSYNGVANVCVYDLQGRVISSQDIKDGADKVNLHIDAAGIYILKLSTPSNGVAVRKLQIL